MIRAFAAIFSDPEARHPLDGLEDDPWVRLIPAPNLHLTLAFLGEIPAARVQAAGEALVCAAAGLEPFQLGLGGRLASLDRRRRVVAADIDGELDRLELLWNRLQAALADAGFPTPGREFRPHLTLARIRRDSTAAARRRIFQRAGQRLAPLRIGFRVDEVGLYRSRLGAGGASYTPLRLVKLGRRGLQTESCGP